MAIPEKIKQLANDIRTKIYGKEVRESLARGIEEAGKIADETRVRQDNVEAQFQAVLDETTNKDVISAPEITAARVGADNSTYANLKERLDKENQEVMSHLAQIETDKADKSYVDTKTQANNLSYKESYATLTDLQNAYPNGDTYNHVVLADNMIYTWVNNEWVNTQIQASGTGLSPNSVDSENVVKEAIGIDKTTFVGYTNESVNDISYLTNLSIVPGTPDIEIRVNQGDSFKSFEFALEKNTWYKIKKSKTDRFRLALMDVSVSNISSTIKRNNSRLILDDADKLEYSFYSGDNNYALVQYTASGETLTALEVHKLKNASLKNIKAESDVRTPLGEVAYVGANLNGEYIDFDFYNLKINIPNNIPVISRNRRFFANEQSLDMVTGFFGATAALYFDTSNGLFTTSLFSGNQTGTFEEKQGTTYTPVSENNILVAIYRTDQGIVTMAGNQYSINGAKQDAKKSPSGLSWASIFNFRNSRILIDSTTKSITFEKDLVVFYGLNRYILPENQVIPIPSNIEGSFAITFDEVRSTFDFEVFPLDRSKGTHHLVAVGNWDYKEIYSISGTFTWDGKEVGGNAVDEGVYQVLENGAVIKTEKNPGWSGWQEDRLKFGMDTHTVPVPATIESPLIINGTLITGGSNVRNMRWGFHVREGYASDNKSRITELVNKHIEEGKPVAELYYYLTAYNHTEEAYGWFRVGSDVKDHSFMFSRDKAIAFGEWDLRNVMTLARISPSNDLLTTYQTKEELDAAHEAEFSSINNAKGVLYLALKNAQNGAMFYDTDRNQIVIKRNGVWCDMNVTPVPDGTYNF